MELSANIELLFTEAGNDFGDRVRAATDAGITTVEIWFHSNKDLEALGRALRACGARVWTLLVEGRVPLADRESHPFFLEHVTQACQAARTLNCPHIVTGSGVGFPYMRRAQQHDIVVDALRAGADIAAEHGVVLLLENLNTRVDHPGTLFDTTTECLAAIRKVDHPGLALLFDLYHALQMGDAPGDVLRDHLDRVAHVQIADVPDRTEPGSGRIDWMTQLRTLRDLGYDGPVGLEYTPTTETRRSLAHIQAVLQALDAMPRDLS
ncbi:TIM barrel protein [Rhodocaloribacter litoris]|uniref:TIM barrel protein n=1 Tax=Rhodocaloribacter litoris TaxID=2558931 RepID=UPI00141E2A50|nr:TIM barrel protein [Rhodocaloribacter litoris]QXD15398.1 TIM barrel protein [Rhodocaloribacter litoris]